MKNQQGRIFFVDDEPAVGAAVWKTLTREGLQVTCFDNADACLKALEKEACHVLICDVAMPKVSGFSLLLKVRRVHPALPVIMVTGYGDVRTAVKAMKAGATDFIEKPLDAETLLYAVKTVMERQGQADFAQGKSLTPTERQILELIVAGCTNKEMARSQHRSIRTIEDHRRRIMLKLGVANVVELVKLVTAKTPKTGRGEKIAP